MDVENLSFVFYHKYGIFGEKLLALILKTPNAELAQFLQMNLKRLFAEGAQDIVLFNAVREELSGELIPVIPEDKPLITSIDEFRAMAEIGQT